MHHKPTIQKIGDLVASRFKQAAEQGRAPRSLLEIGPGKLALTEVLAPLAAAHEIPLFLVERDRFLEPEISPKVAGMGDVNLHFMDAATEALTALIDQLSDQGLAPVFVASNLPYSASSQILANLCHRGSALSGVVVMVQKELAIRMTAPPGGKDRGAFSLLIQSYFKTTAAFDVGPGAFSPPPQVMSTVLQMTPLVEPMTAGLQSALAFEVFCKKLFSQRRKMIRNLVPPEKHALFPKLGISGTERPETLALRTVLELFKSLEPLSGS